MQIKEINNQLKKIKEDSSSEETQKEAQKLISLLIENIGINDCKEPELFVHLRFYKY